MRILMVLGLIPWALAVVTPAAADAPLTLQECVHEALAANPDLGAAAARTDAADAAAAVVAAGRRPRLDLTAGYLYSERAQRLAQPSFPGEPLRYANDIAEAALELRAPLYAGGRLAAAVRAADFAAASSRLASAATRQDLVLEVAAAYLAAVAQRSAVEAVQASLDALDGQLAVARVMEEVGRIAPLDRLKVEVRAAAVRQLLSRTRRDRELVLNHLAALLGRDPGARSIEVGETPVLPAVDDGRDELVAETLAGRPELMIARYELESAHEALAIAVGERRPEVDAYARYTARSAVLPNHDDLPGHEQYGAAGLVLRLPLATGGALKARAAEARARVREAEQRARAVELWVTEEVRQSLAAQQEAAEREAVARGALAQAREAFVVERSNYELGRSTVNDVLDAQAALLEAELAHAEASHDLALAAISVTRAAGRGVVEFISGENGARQ